MSLQLPYSKNSLIEQLDSLCGVGLCLVDVDYTKYLLTVRVALTVRDNYGDVTGLVRRMMPANLILDISLNYNTYDKISVFKHSELASMTYYDVKNQIIS